MYLANVYGVFKDQEEDHLIAKVFTPSPYKGFAEAKSQGTSTNFFNFCLICTNVSCADCLEIPHFFA